MGSAFACAVVSGENDLQEPIGEAWLTGLECACRDGPFAGKSLGEELACNAGDWRGTASDRLPEFSAPGEILFPNDKLSIQVHPDDAYAGKYEQAAGGRGKTEMWHIVSPSRARNRRPD